MNELRLKFVFFAGLALALIYAQNLGATEDAPHAPFAQWADLPAPGQFVAGFFYDESESYHIYANGGQRYNIDSPGDGEHYGIDVNQGWLTFQYGIDKHWAADMSIGATTVGWRDFSNGGPPGAIRETTGIADIGLGVRYQIFNEAVSTNSFWLPTLTFRAGAVLPGTYKQNLAFAPGLRSAAIEPKLLAKKHFGWPGFGAYGDLLYRWNRTTGNDQVIGSIGFFQQIKGWELDAGYRRLQTLEGTDLLFDPATKTLATTGSDPHAFSELREINDSIEAGFSYTTPKWRIKYSFYTRTVFAGNSSDQKFWIGAGAQMPFQIFRFD
ncbi:MAG TPA: hypothetical protein VFC85_07510 [Verrucomicrobiae bacterium]|nr:hypothetical protein [Verrucomicrobiae bacterium]